jgi:hypothetical protein
MFVQIAWTAAVLDIIGPEGLRLTPQLNAEASFQGSTGPAETAAAQVN